MRTIFTNFRCDEPQTTAEPCVVDFDLELPIPEYVDFCKHLDEDYGFISEATGELVKDKHGLNHCMLILCEGRDDGILVKSEGYNYARYHAYLPRARQIMQMEQHPSLDEFNRRMVSLVERYVGEALKCQLDGQYRIDLDKLQSSTDGQTFDNDLFAEMLSERREIRSVEMDYQNYVKPAIRETTQATYEGNIYRHIIPEIGKIPLNQISESDLQQFYSKMLKRGRIDKIELFGAGLAPSMVRRMHTLCRAALEKAVEDGFIRKNPSLDCKLPPKKGTEMQVLSVEEMQRFLIQAKYDGFFELYLTELTTGLRIGELLALRWDDINFRTGAVNVFKQATMAKGKMQITTPKTQSSIRTVYLSKPVLEALKEYQKTVDSQWVFPSQRRDELPLHPSAVRKRLHATLERAGCKEVRFHDLRHTFATMALENGMDVKTLSAMLGHVSSATTLDVYSHVTDTMQEKAAISIDRKIGKTDAQYQEESRKTVADQRGFKAVEGNRRRPGTGCLHQISEYLWEGRYSRKNEEGKRVARTVYGKTKEECEEKLTALVESIKAEKLVKNSPEKSQDLDVPLLAM